MGSLSNSRGNAPLSLGRFVSRTLPTNLGTCGMKPDVDLLLERCVDQVTNGLWRVVGAVVAQQVNSE